MDAINISSVLSNRDADTHAVAAIEPTQPPAAMALRANSDEGELAYLPLRALRLDEVNVRREKPSDADIDQLADLIDAQGLLQNLTVVAYARLTTGKGKAKAPTHTHGVVAGGRRLLALLRLVQRGRLSRDEEILCAVVLRERALAVSTAENSGRVALSTADTITAFADMVRAGAGVEELAVCFGVSALTVQRRLKLANVCPTLFELFRQGQMTLDQLMALALADAHTSQQAAWVAAPANDRSARRLRGLIVGQGLSQAIIDFVGLPAYEQAGGAVLRDLFEDDDSPPAYVQDTALMMSMASQMLEAVAEGLRNDGAQWVRTFTHFGYEDREQFGPVPTTRRAATEQEQQQLAGIHDQAERLDAELSLLYDGERDGEGDDDGDGAGSKFSDGDPANEDDAAKIVALEGQIDELRSQGQAIEQAQRVIAPELAQFVGSVAYIDSQGGLKTLRHLVRKADMAAIKRAMVKASTANPAAAVSECSGKPELDQEIAGHKRGRASGLSDRLRNQLSSHRTRALQTTLLANQQIALAALVHPMLTRMVCNLGASYNSPSALAVSASDCHGQLKTCAPDLAGSRADDAMTVAVADVKSMLPEDAADLLPWLLIQPVDVLIRLLTLCSALSLNAVSSSEKAHPADALAGALGLDMRQWWAPTAASYLAAVPKALIVEAVAQAGMPLEAKDLAKLKKGDAVAKAEALLAGKGWLPAMLR